MKPKNNFLEQLSNDELKTFKKRMVGSILATYMAKHFEDLASFKRRIELNGIKKELNNGNLFLDRHDGKTLFES